MLKVAIILLSPRKYLFSIELEIWATVLEVDETHLGLVEHPAMIIHSDTHDTERN